MKKWFEVTVKSFNTYLVEVNNDEDPTDIVSGVITDDWDEMESTLIDERELEIYKRNTDKDKIIAL